MLPSALVMLEALPLNSNGKIDRSKLPAPIVTQANVEQRELRRPWTPVESVLAAAFASLLGLESVDIDSSFFDLGGHSLLAIQLVSRIRNLLHIDFPVRLLFDNPTVAGLAAAIASSPKNAATAGAVTEQDRDFSNQTDLSVLRRTDRDFVPLSLTQEQMWFIDQLSPDSAAYNMPHAFRLEGALNLSALEHSLNEIVRRHESLRTTFASIDGTPVQVVAPELTIKLNVIDVSARDDDEREKTTTLLVSEEARRPFNLATGPLLRCSLLKSMDAQQVLLFVMHHIVSDGWSWVLFLKELSVLYEAFCKSEPSPLQPLPVQYPDFAQWQHDRLQKGELEQRLSYWSNRLDRAPGLLELPLDHPRPAVQTFRGAAYSEVLPQDLKKKLEALSRSEGVTLFMTLCAAFNALLFRWTGQEDIVVGSTISGRNRAEFESVIGLFINTLLLRTDLSGNPTFRQLLHRVRESALGAYANQEVPFDKLMERLRSKRSLSHGTLFQVLFILHQGTSEQELALSGMTVSTVPVENGTVKFALSVHLVDRPDGLSCNFTYQTDLFELTTIQRMVAQFKTLLGSASAAPDASLHDLPIMSDAEIRALLVEYNETKTDYPKNNCIHDLFEEQAKRTPEATAVLFEGRGLSYRELNRRANQLSNYLRGSGACSGSLVVLCMERSPEMIVALLAVLKSGGAYVPVDPRHSRERLPWILNDTAAPVLLTEKFSFDAVTNCARTDSARTVCVDLAQWVFSEESAETSDVRITPDHLAYVIYTSGSTGTPKAVEIPHVSLVNFVFSSIATFELQPSDRMLQFASLSFDTAVEEIFPCLVAGATLVLRTDQMLGTASVFLQHCEEWKITVLDLPTVYWHELTENIFSGNLKLPDGLRLVVLGGDKAMPERVAEWHKCSRGRVRLLNEYGPTEATVVATTHELGAGAQSREVPIGRPIANVQTYVLDRHLNPVPIGVPGELHIGGVGVARGYHKRPDLTAEAFIPDPFGDGAGGRLYKTGDLARYLPDGTLEFVGRLDHQVKVRGFRVEPGEIEMVLTENSTVRQVVVVAQTDMSGDNRLIAYVVLVPGSRATPQDLRDFVIKRLPDYMVPSAFMIVDVLPLTASGKVDRHALPQPDQTLHPQTSFVAPRTMMERQLAEEWEKLLDVRPIGVQDNFFDLGGHSLLGVRLIARLEKRFGKTLPVAVLFQSATIEQLAITLEQKWPESWSLLIPIQTCGSKLPFFWIHGDTSNAILPQYLGPDQPLYAIEHQSQDGRAARYTEVEQIAQYYLREIFALRTRGPYLLGGYSFGAVIAFEMAQQLRARGEHVPFLFMLDPPGKQRKPKSSRPLPSEVRRHLQVLATLEPQEKLGYLLPRLRQRIHPKKGWMRRNITKLRWKTSLAVGHLLPPSVRSAYILNIYQQALANYLPRPYSGPVTLFKTEGESYRPRFDWTCLTTGELQIHEGFGEHMDLRKEPYIRVWAEYMTQSLDRAQQTLKIGDRKVDAYQAVKV